MKKKLDQDDQILTRKWMEVVYLAVLFLAAALMNGFLMLRNPNIGADALKYHAPIHNLLAGKGWRYYTGEFAWVDPGYGAISYLFFLFVRDIELSGMLASSFSYLLLIPTVYLSSRYLFDKRVAVMVSSFVAFSPALLASSYINLTESTYTFFFS